MGRSVRRQHQTLKVQGGQCSPGTLFRRFRWAGWGVCGIYMYRDDIQFDSWSETSEANIAPSARGVADRAREKSQGGATGAGAVDPGGGCARRRALPQGRGASARARPQAGRGASVLESGGRASTGDRAGGERGAALQAREIPVLSCPCPWVSTGTGTARQWAHDTEFVCTGRHDAAWVQVRTRGGLSRGWLRRNVLR